ncbi:MAG: Mur ligase family protein [Candidatus Dormibacteria bacterium]
MTIPVWQAVLLTLLAAASLRGRYLGWLYICQLDEYRLKRLWASCRRRLRSNWRWQLPLWVGGLVMALVAGWPGGSIRWVPLFLAALLPFFTDQPFSSRGQLLVTSRARRLGLAAAALSLVALFFALWAGWEGAVVLAGGDLLLVGALALGVLALAPDERRRRRGFVRQAQARLEAVAPLVVGITGSYGKTTTKRFLERLLDSPETPCFATPESFNTTLGVCRAINEGLEPRHRYAVLEMGAYRKGEIAEICSFTRPQLGIVTAVGVMHLERFGTRSKIALAKSELLAALPETGLAVLPSSVNERELLTRPLRARVVWVGGRGDRYWAEEIQSGPEGTELRLLGSAGEDLRLRVPVHGDPIISDLLCAWAVAAELGVSQETLSERALRLEPAPHRLQVSQVMGVTIIDDAYNSNPEGAAAALRLMAGLPGQRRVLVTPGFIELGPLQEQSMRELGRQAAAVCSHVILVGRIQSREIALGLGQAGYPLGQLTVAQDLAEAQRRLPDVAGRGSVVLFENDLPDSYLEPG